jgi:hypothetical protein
MEDEWWTWCFMLHFSGIRSLWGKWLFKRLHHAAIMAGPSAPLRWRRLIPTFPRELRESVFRPTVEWKDKVDDLVATLQALGPVECEMIKWKMTLIVNPNHFQTRLYHYVPKHLMDHIRSMAFGW